MKPQLFEIIQLFSGQALRDTAMQPSEGASVSRCWPTDRLSPAALEPEQYNVIGGHLTCPRHISPKSAAVLGTRLGRPLDPDEGIVDPVKLRNELRRSATLGSQTSQPASQPSPYER